MTLISAPAGSGKTSVLRAWVARHEPTVAWLSLDPEDNDPTRFWTYVIAALQRLQPGLAKQAHAVLQAQEQQPHSFESVLTMLLNELVTFPDTRPSQPTNAEQAWLQEGVALVLDDYHVIDNPAIHTGIAFLIDHLPTHLHVLIDTQAWRGTISHFNASTTLNRALFIVMSTAILLQTFVSVAVAVALWRQRFTDQPLGLALRLGMILTILGALTGPLMTRPSAEQIADARVGRGMPIIGAHTVGGSDGDPGVPVTGWNREHGDLHVPHFIGLHAIQALALIAVGLRWWYRPEAVRVRAVLAAAASYAVLFLLLLWAALRGQSIVAPDATARASLAIWALVTVLALGWIGFGSGGAAPDGFDRMAA